MGEKIVRVVHAQVVGNVAVASSRGAFGQRPERARISGRFRDLEILVHSSVHSGQTAPAGSNYCDGGRTTRQRYLLARGAGVAKACQVHPISPLPHVGLVGEFVAIDKKELGKSTKISGNTMMTIIKNRISPPLLEAAVNNKQGAIEPRTNGPITPRF